MVGHIQTFIFRLCTTEEWLQVNASGPLVGAFNPVLRAATHVVPLDAPGVVALLAAAELFQVVRRTHARDIKEIFVLTDATGPVFPGFTFGCPAVDGDLGLVDIDRAQY